MQKTKLEPAMKKVEAIEDATTKVAKEKEKEEEIQFESKLFSEPTTLTITPEAWNQPGARVALASRFDWPSKGARVYLINIVFSIAAKRGCHYIVINGGLVNERYVKRQISDELEQRSLKHNKVNKDQVTEFVLDEIARELASILPQIKKPTGICSAKGESECIRIYIVTSSKLDGELGRKIVRKLQYLRDDIRVLKEGSDTTRLKGFGTPEEIKQGGRKIQHVTYTQSLFTGQYLSTNVQTQIRRLRKSSEGDPSLFSVCGGGNISKPGGGEESIAYIGLPICHAPMQIESGDAPSDLNEVGVRVLEVQASGPDLIESYMLRDLIANERQQVTLVKKGSSDIHQTLVNAIKLERKGYQLGELADLLGHDRNEVQEALNFLIEPKALSGKRWPGLYYDRESERYNFHLNWFQRMKYIWPYDKDYQELRRLISACSHIGYTTTDYRYIRERFPQIILENDINVLEAVGDITAGLKHELIQRGQIIGNINYTEQEIFAGELKATVMYDVWVVRFELLLLKIDSKNQQALAQAVFEALILLLYIMGNHDNWQTSGGHTPGVTFKATVILTLFEAIRRYLDAKGLYVADLLNIISSKVIELPEHNPVYDFGGVKTFLIHPSMARASTESLRAEEALSRASKQGYRCQLVDVGNFHVSTGVGKHDSKLGERVAVQAGCMLLGTEFENTKMKTVDFGPIYSCVRYKNGRIFYSALKYYSDAFIKAPISKDTDINQLKKELGILRKPF